jgi:thiamine biosynthesis lipoprotein
MTLIVRDKQAGWRWQSDTFKAMNTQVKTWLYGRVSDNEVLMETKRLFLSFEKRLSRFDPDSELSRLNSNEHGVIEVSPTLFDALEVALLAAETTGGLYDPTILDSLEHAGYDRSFEWIDNPSPLTLPARFGPPRSQSPTRRPGFSFRSVQLYRARCEVQKPAGVRLDLGGMGKGWTVDRAVDMLQGLGPFLINAGGDIFAYHAPPGKKGWEIDIIHPLSPEKFVARVRLCHKALATSTIARRRWRRNGRIMHHLIDPRTGRPAQTDAVSVTVVTDRTVLAEIYAKVALILGADQGLAYLHSLPGVEGLIYTNKTELVYTDGLRAMLDRFKPEGYVN